MIGLKSKTVPIVLMFAAILFGLMGGEAESYAGAQAKNIIFMVPDGMGLADVTAARIFANGPDGDRLAFEKLPVIGYQRTYSASSTVTDSAAAASAWATGEKYKNGEISCHDANGDGACDTNPVPTILDIAKSMGKSTGQVVTSDITHATPAAFGANVHNRKCEEEIARNYLARKIDVLLGGGIAANRPACLLPASKEGYLAKLIAAYTAADYAYVQTKSDLESAVSAKAGKIIGLFKQGGKTREIFRVDPAVTYPQNEPSLPEMTQAALDTLERNRKGFFLLVEGSQIDWANHANDLKGQLAETLSFAAATEVVLKWVKARAARARETLIVVAADHETGGFAINGPYNKLSAKGTMVEAAWTSKEHTAVDTLIWSQGPASDQFGRALDNTDLYSLMKKALK